MQMVYLNLDDGGSDEVVEEVGSHMSHHGHLRTVYMSGFRCYNDQVKLAYCILQNARVLEHKEIQPRVAAGMFPISGSWRWHSLEAEYPFNSLL